MGAACGCHLTTNYRARPVHRLRLLTLEEAEYPKSSKSDVGICQYPMAYRRTSHHHLRLYGYREPHRGAFDIILQLEIARSDQRSG